MKQLSVHQCRPSPSHLRLASQFGGKDLEQMDCETAAAFHRHTPEAPGFVRAEPGCLIKMRGNVIPHVDTWLGDFRQKPRVQRSLFWVLRGWVMFKVHGLQSLSMFAGDWVLFDHRREHLVMSDGRWMGAAWQMKKAA